MGITRKSKLVALGAAVLTVAGGSAAIAATGSGTPADESKAIVETAAKDLGVTSTELSAALKKALIARVDAQLQAGTITEAQATSLKARINSSAFAIFGPLGGPRGGGFGHHRGAGLAAAATYLGKTEAELRTSLESGKSLADVAKATSGKSVDGLVAAIVAAEKKELAAAVTAGRLTEAQQKEILASLEQRVTDMVNGVRPAGGPRGHGGHGGPSFLAPAAGAAA